MFSRTPPCSADSKRSTSSLAPSASARSPLNFIGVLCVGNGPPIRPDCAWYTRLALLSNSTKGWSGCSAEGCLRNSLRMTEPPSVSNTSLSTSVVTSMRSRAMASAAGAGAAVPGGMAVAPGVAAGTALAAGGTAEAGALAVTAGCDAPGKKVGRLPLCTCHWSHSMTSEKAKITQRMVRRMSFIAGGLAGARPVAWTRSGR